MLSHDHSYGALISPVKNLILVLTRLCTSKDTFHVYILLKQGIIAKLNDLFTRTNIFNNSINNSPKHNNLKKSTKYSKLLAACQILHSLLTPTCMPDFIRAQGVFLTLQTLIQTPMQSQKDVELNVWYFKIYKRMMEGRKAPEEMVVQLQIAESVMGKVGEMCRLKE